MSTVSTVVYNSTSTLGQASTKSLTHINPDAGNGVLEGLASRVNALSTNIYGGATRIDKTDLDAEPTTKTTPTLTLARPSISVGDFKTEVQTAKQAAPFGILVDINYNGDGSLHVKSAFNNAVGDIADAYVGAKIIYVDGAPKLWLTLPAGADNSAFSSSTKFTVLADETDTCNPASVIFNFTMT